MATQILTISWGFGVEFCMIDQFYSLFMYKVYDYHFPQEMEVLITICCTFLTAITLHLSALIGLLLCDGGTVLSRVAMWCWYI